MFQSGSPPVARLRNPFSWLLDSGSRILCSPLTNHVFDFLPFRRKQPALI